jgi:hypothetical protein
MAPTAMAITVKTAPSSPAPVGEVAGETKVTIMDQGMWQALYDTVFRQGYLFDALAADFITPPAAPMHGVSAWLQREAEERWEICKEIKKKMVKYGAAPISPAIPAISPGKPEGAMQVIMAGEAACLAAAHTLLASGCKHIQHIYYEGIGYQHDETKKYFQMFPAKDPVAQAEFDRKMRCEYSKHDD